jgi:CYTH domain-containing protein
MTGLASTGAEEQGQEISDLPVRDGKYARVERERRFLLAEPPPASSATGPRQITDRYLTGTRLRLRRVDHHASGAREFKLTQKVPSGRPGPVQGLITNIYLSEAEYDRFGALPAAVLSKTRVIVPPVGIDIFGPPLHGLVLAEAEFATDGEASSFRPPPGSIAEVTDDPRFTGGRLARTQRTELLGWLAEFGILPPG